MNISERLEVANKAELAAFNDALDRLKQLGCSDGEARFVLEYISMSHWEAVNAVLVHSDVLLIRLVIKWIYRRGMLDAYQIAANKIDEEVSDNE